MKRIFVTALILASIWACGSNDTGTDASKSVSSDKKIDGKKIYSRYCVSCHGMYGNMGTSGAFDLTKSELNVSEKVQVITNGRKLMTSFKSTLSAEEIKAVAEYTETLKLR